MTGHDLRLHNLVILMSCLFFEFFRQEDSASINFHFRGVLKPVTPYLFSKSLRVSVKIRGVTFPLGEKKVPQD